MRGSILGSKTTPGGLGPMVLGGGGWGGNGCELSGILGLNGILGSLNGGGG